MTAVWSRIAAFTNKYPLSRGMMSYACIWPLGSCVQQKIQGKETLDYWRALRFSLYGCCFVAPTLYTWMTIAGYLFPKPGLRSGIYKALVEQVSYTPSAMICFYFFMTLLEGGTLDEACQEVKSKFLPTYKVGACVWPVLQTFNFTVVPPQNRVPFAVVEQFTYGPFAVCGFYSGMTLLEGGSFEDAVEETKLKFLPTWQTAVCVWPVVQTVNFCFIPERNRVPFVSVCSFMWTVFLAYMKQRSQELEQQEELNASQK